MLTLETKLEVCKKSHKRFETDICGHYLQECNLCGERTYCTDHGCDHCSLKKDENAAALSVMPEDERQMLLTIRERELNLAPQKRPKNKARVTPVNYSERYLDDALEINKANGYLA